MYPRKDRDGRNGSLGAVLVGLLVLVAIGGAYSLGSYPVPVYVGSAVADVRSQEVSAVSADDASVQSLLVDACMQVTKGGLAQDAGYPHANGRQMVRLGNRMLSPEEFNLLVAFFGTIDGNTHIDAANIGEKLHVWVEANAHRLTSPELLEAVDCGRFAENLLRFAAESQKLTQQ